MFSTIVRDLLAAAPMNDGFGAADENAPRPIFPSAGAAEMPPMPPNACRPLRSARTGPRIDCFSLAHSAMCASDPFWERRAMAS